MIIRALRTRHSFSEGDTSYELEAAVLGRILVIPVDEEFVEGLDGAISDMEQSKQVKPGRQQTAQPRKVQQTRRAEPVSEYVPSAEYDVGALSGFDGDD